MYPFPPTPSFSYSLFAGVAVAVIAKYKQFVLRDFKNLMSLKNISFQYFKTVSSESFL